MNKICDIKLKLKSELTPDNSYLSSDAMSLTVQTLKEHKRNPFNCLIFEGKKENLSELKEFLSTLDKYKKNYPDNTRIQFLFNYSSTDRGVSHWMTGDIRISNGKLEFYLLNASDFASGIIIQIALILALCPEAKITSTTLNIQKDQENCAYFALDHAMALAKIPDLHEQLAQIPEAELNNDNHECLKKAFDHRLKSNAVSYSTSSSDHRNFLCQTLNNPRLLQAYSASEYLDEQVLEQSLKKLNQLREIPRDLLPKQFGSLFKNTQDMHFNTEDYKRYPKKSLKDYINKHMQQHIEKDKKSMRNTAIISKKNKMKERTLKKLNLISDEDCSTIISQRRGEYFLVDFDSIIKKMEQEKATLDGICFKIDSLTDTWEEQNQSIEKDGTSVNLKNSQLTDTTNVASITAPKAPQPTVQDRGSTLKVSQPTINASTQSAVNNSARNAVPNAEHEAEKLTRESARIEEGGTSLKDSKAVQKLPAVLVQEKNTKHEELPLPQLSEKSDIVVGREPIFSDEVERLTIEDESAHGRTGQTEKFLRDSKEVQQLHTAIEKLRLYGEALTKRAPKKSSIAIQLSQQLSRQLTTFIEQGNRSEPSYLRFKNSFKETLHSQNELFEQHRAYHKVIIANIVIALTGLGALFIIGKLFHSYLTAGKADVFFSKTQGQQNIEAINTSLELPLNLKS